MPRPLMGPHKTIYSRFMSGSQLGVFDRIFAEHGRDSDCTLMIDATHLEPRRTAASPQVKRGHGLSIGYLDWCRSR